MFQCEGIAFQWKESMFQCEGIAFQCEACVNVFMFSYVNSIVVQLKHSMDVPHGGEDAAVVAHTGPLRERKVKYVHSMKISAPRVNNHI